MALEQMHQLAREPFRMAAIIIVPLAQELPTGRCNADVSQLAEAEGAGWGHDADVAALERYDVVEQSVATTIDTTVDYHHQLLAHQGLAAVGRDTAHDEVEPFGNGQRQHQTTDHAFVESGVACH